MLVAADGIGTESEALAAEDIGPESEEVAAEDVVDPLLSVDDSDPLLSVAQDSQEPDEVIVVLAADGMVPDSQEMAADGVARAITSRLHASGRPAKTNAHARPCKNMMINKINLGNQYSNADPVPRDHLP